MHEISICQNIINTIESEFTDQQLESIREIHLKIGLLSCVEPRFIKQVFGLMVNDSLLKRASLHVESVDIEAECENCSNQFKVEGYVFVCPVCGTSSSKIISGKELTIHKILFEEFSYEETNQ